MFLLGTNYWLKLVLYVIWELQLTFPSHGICIFLVWYLEQDLGLLHSLVLGHYHRWYSVHFILLLFCQSMTEYCDVVWSLTAAKFTGMLERVDSKLPSQTIFYFDWTLALSYSDSDFQIYSPSYLLNIFHYSKDVTGYCGCNVNRFFVPRVVTNFGKRSFYYRGAVLWNSLPLRAVEAATMSASSICILIPNYCSLCMFVLCALLCMLWSGLHWKQH